MLPWIVNRKKNCQHEIPSQFWKKNSWEADVGVMLKQKHNNLYLCISMHFTADKLTIHDSLLVMVQLLPLLDFRVVSLAGLVKYSWICQQNHNSWLLFLNRLNFPMEKVVNKNSPKTMLCTNSSPSHTIYISTILTWWFLNPWVTKWSHLSLFFHIDNNSRHVKKNRMFNVENMHCIS